MDIASRRLTMMSMFLKVDQDSLADLDSDGGKTTIKVEFQVGCSSEEIFHPEITFGVEEEVEVEVLGEDYSAIKYLPQGGLKRRGLMPLSIYIT